MIALIQRVSQARVYSEGELLGEIGAGTLALVCAERGDRRAQADALLAKLLAYRVFADDAGRMNRNLREVGGGLLLVPQFTLAADTNAGTRPSFTPAAPPELGRELYQHFVAAARREHPVVASGRFGAMMQVELVNDGPVTFWLRVGPDRQAPQEERA
jgi:D-tyrosyl-tRNA(Tyr) deacylase